VTFLRYKPGDLLSKLWGQMSSTRLHRNDATEVELLDAGVVYHLMHHGRDEHQRGDLVSSATKNVKKAPER